MEAYVKPKLSKTGKDILGEISALADKTAQEKATLGQPKEQEEKLAKPPPKGLKFPNLEGTRNTKKGKEIKSKEIVIFSESESESTRKRTWSYQLAQKEQVPWKFSLHI